MLRPDARGYAYYQFKLLAILDGCDVMVAACSLEGHLIHLLAHRERWKRVNRRDDDALRDAGGDNNSIRVAGEVLPERFRWAAGPVTS
jgi:hypothetical protein